MAATPAVEPSAPASTAADIHYQIVSQRVPQWLLKAPAQQRQALREQRPQATPWLAEARTRMPEVLAAWHDEQQRHAFHAGVMEDLLKQLPSPEAFAEPLLREALKRSFGLDLDVRHTYLFNAARARVDVAHFTTRDPLVKAFQVVNAATQPLLLAALQNFEAWEAETDGLRDGRRPSLIFASDSGQALAPSREIELAPERFAALCRTLDLGGRYQRLIDGVFNPAPRAQESAEVAAINRQSCFQLFEQSVLRLNLHLARLRGEIDQTLYEDLLLAAKNGPAQGGLHRSVLKLWDVPLNGIVLFYRQTAVDSAPEQLVVYMPDDGKQPLQVFDSIKAFHDVLRDRLSDPAWRHDFMRFVPARERSQLLRRLQLSLYPKVWNPGGWYEEQYDAHAVLRLNKEDFAAPLLNQLLQRKIAVLKDDGLFHAVPTADEDHKSTQDKIAYFLGVGFNLLNVAAFVVPGLGPVMLTVNAALLGYEVYEGFDSLSRGDQEAAWGYFMDVAENLVLMAALGVVGGAGQRFDGQLPLGMRSMRPVTLADGSVRLWKPDIAPFAYDIRLPSDLQPDSHGLYDWQGRQWLKLEGRHYSVRTLLGEAQGYRLEHPARVGAYEPTLRPNGNGGWLHEADSPERWSGMQLFRRQGYREAQLSEGLAKCALRISGISEAQLRQTLIDCQRPPALLTDTLRRLELAERLDAAGTLDASTFASEYRALQPPLSAAGEQLRQRFKLPDGIVAEIVAAASAQERAELDATASVPARLAEEARIYLQQVRIARACEGLYMDIEANADNARLMLHALETLPEWPAGLRLAIYEGSLDGRLLGAIGPEQEPAVAVIWRGQLPRGFCKALFDAIPGVFRERLGLIDAATLRDKLRAQPLVPRQRLRQWLGMQAIRPAFRSPMRLADGRIGHPLSGRGGNPFFTEDELLDKLRLLELEDVYVEDALQALYRSGLDRPAISARLDGLLDEMLQLRACLDRWVLDSAKLPANEVTQRSRERIGLALWEYWRRSILPELGQPVSRLILVQVQLADLPVQLPEFLRQRVRAILLDDVVYRTGASYEQIIGENQLQAFANAFPNLASLDIRGGDWGADLVQMIARVWPRLAALGLNGVNAIIGQQDLRALATLSRLRRLELSGIILHEMPASALDGLTLDYLGLDRLGLLAWPQWLHSAALARIGELSLVGNQLSELPEAILGDVTPVARPMRIALHGNRFLRQALLDLRLAERFGRRFVFDLSLLPGAEAELNQRLIEFRQLQASIQAWVDSASPTAPISAEQRAYRQRIGNTLMLYWREHLQNAGSALLSLEGLRLDDTPENLPTGVVTALHRLELVRFEGSTEQLERFVRRFPGLHELALADGRPALTQVPAALVEMPQLRELVLVDMGMTIDQAAMHAFARNPLLSTLQLDGNRLGEISDMSLFRHRTFSYLGLERMAITTWPAWLDQLLPSNIERLGLDGNLLTRLPDYILENRRQPDGAVEISLRNNPLTRDTLIQAFVSQHYNRPYTFALDLPNDVIEMEQEAHTSDSEDESDGQSDPCLEDENFVQTWATGEAGRDARHQQLWTTLTEDGDAEWLLRLIALLRHSADYRSTATRTELIDRVWDVLAAAGDDTELRLTLNGMAEEPVQQLDRHETCPDGIRLEFNQIEFQVHTRQALRNLPEGNRGPALFRLMRGIFRAQTLDRLAREAARDRDEAEVRLAYRLRWAQDLQLPLPPRSMLYRTDAHIVPGELDRALATLRQEESGVGLLRFAAQCDFWAAYLRETFAERFNALKVAYEAAVLDAMEQHPDESSEQSSVRIAALEAKFKAQQQGLLEELTVTQALSAG